MCVCARAPVLSVCVCLCVCEYVCVVCSECVHMHIFVFVCMCIYSCACVCIYVCVRACVLMCMCISMCAMRAFHCVTWVWMYSLTRVFASTTKPDSATRFGSKASMPCPKLVGPTNNVVKVVRVAGTPLPFIPNNQWGSRGTNNDTNRLVLGGR